jgi:hypothetical protein
MLIGFTLVGRSNLLWNVRCIYMEFVEVKCIMFGLL